MTALGLFTLGIFVGTIVTMGVEKVNDWSNIQKVLGAIFSAVFAGVILVFIRTAAGENLQEAAPYYPIGLFYGLLWYYARAAVAHVQANDTGMKALGWLHIAGLALSAILAGLIFLSPSFRSQLPQSGHP
jgi:hypothetical protein